MFVVGMTYRKKVNNGMGSYNGPLKLVYIKTGDYSGKEVKTYVFDLLERQTITVYDGRTNKRDLDNLEMIPVPYDPDQEGEDDCV